MDSAAAASADVEFDFPPFFRTYKDGRVERLEPDEFVPHSPDPQNDAVCSKDVEIDPDTGISARLFIPSKHLLAANAATKKLPLLIYIHGGGFMICTPFNPMYHSYLSKQVLEADVIAVSVRYRRAPEHPLPAAYMDCWAAIHWTASHRTGSGPDPWLNRFADFNRVFLAGDSAGANIAHNMAMSAGDEDLGLSIPIRGLILVHPFFWASSPIGNEAQHRDKAMVDRVWPVVCPDSMPDPGHDDPRINPVADRAPSLAGLGCRRVLVYVAGKDVLRDRGRLYFEALGRSGWMGVVEIQETDDEDHVFHLRDFESDKSKALLLVSHDIFPYLRQYKDGTIERLAGTEFIDPGLDPKTGVTSTDAVILPETGVSARIYLPAIADSDQRLPLVVYLHGGAFLIASPGEPKYHNFCNLLAAAANAVVISVDYRKAPEHPLPAAYDDAWDAIRWVAAHAGETFFNGRNVDFGRVFLVGDSAGASMAHVIGCRIRAENPGHGFSLKGIIHIHPYFWGKEPIGSEISDPRKPMVDTWWEYVCPSDKGSDDSLINPFGDGAPRIDELACDRVLVCIAEKDILSVRGRVYYQRLVEMEWRGKAEIYESKGEDHVFHIFDPDCSNAVELLHRLVGFIDHDY
ncbi:hypothetical protein V2J09_007172 [Rumex salicifolius]